VGNEEGIPETKGKRIQNKNPADIHRQDFCFGEKKVSYSDAIPEKWGLVQHYANAVKRK
jgi:hypothetical protein